MMRRPVAHTSSRAACSQHLANLLWAFATLDLHPGRRMMDAVVEVGAALLTAAMHEPFVSCSGVPYASTTPYAPVKPLSSLQLCGSQRCA